MAEIPPPPPGFTLDAKSNIPPPPPGFKLDSASKPNPESQFNAIERGAGKRALGVEELINNLGIGKHIGLPENDILEGAKNIAEEQGVAARSGQGTLSRAGSALGELAGDPLTYIGGAELGAAKGAVQLAKAGAKYGAVSAGTEPGAKNIGENIRNAAEGGAAGAALTPLVGAGIPAVLKGGANTTKLIGEGFGARTIPELKEAAAGIREEGIAHYGKMRELQAGITPDAVKKLTTDVRTELDKTGLWNERLHGDTMSVLKDLSKASNGGISLESLDNHRRLLSAVINKNIGVAGNKEEVIKASAAIRAIDDVVDKLKPEDMTHQGKEAVDALNGARSTWSKARKFEMISDIIEKSDGDPNRMKVLFEQLANNKNKTRGFTEAELDALREAARNTTSEGLLKMAGKFGIKVGNGRAAATGNVLPAIEVGMAGAKKGIPAVLSGTVAKLGQRKIANAKAERLLKLIEQGKTADQAIGAETNPLATIPPQQRLQ